jgi:hypothetical protein
MGDPHQWPRRPGLARPALAPRVLRAWYLATPLFAVLDLILGLNVRVTFLDSTVARLAYYAFAFGCGLAVLRWPRRAGLVGLLESSGNIVWLILGVGAQYLAALDAALAEDLARASVFSTAEVVNLLVSAAILIVSYIAAQARLGHGVAHALDG